VLKKKRLKDGIETIVNLNMLNGYKKPALTFSMNNKKQSVQINLTWALLKSLGTKSTSKITIQSMENNSRSLKPTSYSWNG
jgi:hypothetical protein